MNLLKPKKIDVAVQFGSAYKRICKVVEFNASDGGFCIIPSGQTQSGLLSKIPYKDTVGTYKINENDMVHFQDSERVKLSYHGDGFVQFSKVGSQGIISGRDATGAPKGVGLYSAPISNPIQTGPCMAISAWGTREFKVWKPKPAGNAIIIRDADFYIDEINPAGHRPGIEGVNVSFLMFKTSQLEAQDKTLILGTRRILTPPRRLIAPSRNLPARMIPLNRFITLAVIAERMRFQFRSKSGYCVNGPGDLNYRLCAISPPPSNQGKLIDYCIMKPEVALR